MAQTNVRRYSVQAGSTETFGRVLCSARTQHFVVDGPVQNGCPGEALSPAELFLAGVASCGVELVQVIAAEQNVPLQAVSATIEGFQDREQPVRPDPLRIPGPELLHGHRPPDSPCRPRRVRGRVRIRVHVRTGTSPTSATSSTPSTSRTCATDRS